MPEGNFIKPDAPALKHPGLDTVALMSWTLDARPAFGKAAGEFDVKPDPNLEFVRRSNKLRVGPYLLPQKIQLLTDDLPEGEIKKDSINALNDIQARGADSLYQLGLNKRTLEALREIGITSISKLGTYIREPKEKYLDYNAGELASVSFYRYQEAVREFLAIHQIRYEDLAQIPASDLTRKYPASFKGDVRDLENASVPKYLRAFDRNFKAARSVGQLYASGTINMLDDLSSISDRDLSHKEGIGKVTLALIRGKYPYRS